MKELGVTFHCGSGTDAIRSEKDLKSIDEHNNRKYTNKNNQELNPALSHENVILVGSRYIVEDIKKVYKDEFTEAVYNYNMKQKREDRKILDYYTKINNDKQTNLACEMLFQFGDYDHWKDKNIEERKKMTEVFKNVIDILKDYNIVTAQAVIHYDESCPHMHLVGVPISNDNKRGMEKQVSQNKVITLKNLDLIREDVEKMFAREYKKVFNEEVVIKHGSEFEEHLKISQYKKAKEILNVAKKYEYNVKIKDAVEEELENVKEEIKEIEENINKAEKEKEDKTDKIETLKVENNQITNELTKLETTKNDKLKEKEDKEIELDLYQQKIKDYKDQIQKDKEEAIKLEEEQNKIEEDLKEQEKKIRDVKEELEKKNKEYNNQLTEKNNLEEKQKKINEEKQKIEDFYKNMETIITAEKEKMIKDVEDAKTKFAEEKKKLEDANTELVNNNNDLVNSNNELLKALESEKEKKKNITKEKEKIEKENKETADLIQSLTLEKTRLESEKDELKDIVQNYLEKQKDYNTILTPALKEIKSEEKKKEIIETVKDTIIHPYDTINIKLEGILDPKSRYNKEYKIQVEARKDNKKVDKEILTVEEKENLAYNLASANYSIYSNNFDKMEINYNTSDGKTKIEVTHDYTTKDKIEFEPTRLDNFIILIKEKVTDFKNIIVDSLKQKYGYPNIEKDNYFNREQDKKNKDEIDIEY